MPGFIKHSKSTGRKSSTFSNIILCNPKHCISIPLRSIKYCEANALGTWFYFTNGNSMLSSKYIGYWEKVLPGYFWRIHDHWIVNSKKSHDIDLSEHKIQVGDRWLDVAKRRFKEILIKFKESGRR